MSRGYNDYDGDGPEYNNAWELYEKAIDNAKKGKRGQKLLRELADALDALPVKRLVAGRFVRADGEVCTLGALAMARGVEADKLAHLDQLAHRIDSDGDYGPELVEPLRREASEVFDVARCLAGHIMDRNDGGPDNETSEQRFSRMRFWVAEQIKSEKLEET
jgi:hypothetical protein